MLNKVILIGNLGKDPEVRSLPSGQPVATWTMATSRRWRDKNGQKQEQTEWHQIVCFGKQAEIAGQYLQKGKQVFIEGSLATREWNDRDGNKRQTTEVRALRVIMLGRGEGRAEGAGAGPGRSAPSETEIDLGPAPQGEDDIPF